MTSRQDNPIALNLEKVEELSERQQAYFDKCDEKLGFVIPHGCEGPGSYTPFILWCWMPQD